jgi:hypothetical protein
MQPAGRGGGGKGCTNVEPRLIEDAMARFTRSPGRLAAAAALACAAAALSGAAALIPATARAAPAARAVPAPHLIGCDPSAPVRPAGYNPICNDGAYTVIRLHWSRWSASAAGTGLGRALRAPAPVSPLTPTATAAPSAPPAHATTPPASATAPASTSASPGSGPAGTTALRLGPLTLRVPATWHITYRDARGDYTVSTGSCAGNGGPALGPLACPGFSLMAGAGPTADAPGIGARTYLAGRFAWNPSTGVIGCPGKPSALRTTPSQPLSDGFAPVTAGRTADYTVWELGCDVDSVHGPPAFYFQQRDWYLPGSRILIVDEWSTAGLAHILATATRAG